MRTGPRGPAGAAGATGYAAFVRFTQPSVNGTADVDYTGTNPGIGSILDLIVSGAVAGRYQVMDGNNSTAQLKLLSAGTVAPAAVVGASIALHAGLDGSAGAAGTNAPYWDFANYNVAIVETVTTGRTSAYLICAFDTTPVNYTHSLTGVTFAFKAASTITIGSPIVVRARTNNGASIQSKTQIHTGSGTTQIYTVTFDAPVPIAHDGVGVTVGVYHPNGYLRVSKDGDTKNIPNTLNTFLLGGPGWGYFDVREVVGDNALGVAQTMGAGAMHRITPLITCTPV